MPNNLRNPNPLTRRAVLLRALAAAPLLAACNPLDTDSGPEPQPATIEPTRQPTITVQPTATPLQATTTPRPTPTPYPSEAGRHFQIVTNLPISTLNPHIGFGPREWIAARLTLEPLFEFDAELNPVLFLATEWPDFENGLLDPEGRWVTWRLRDDVVWHDGEPFTADDVVATWRFATDTEGAPRTTRAHFEAVDEIERIDHHTVTIHFNRTNPQWHDLFRGGDGVVLPAHIFEPLIGTFTDYRDEVNQKLPCTGPWKISDFDLDRSWARYERFTGFREPDKPAFDTVEIRFLAGDPLSNARRVLETEGVDYASALDQLSNEELNAVAASGLLATVPDRNVEMLFFNFADPRGPAGQPRSEPGTGHPLLGNPIVRRAISAAIPRARLAEVYGKHRAEPYRFPAVLPEEMRGMGAPDQNPDSGAIRRELDQFGVRGGSLLLRTTVNAVRQEAQEVIAEALEAIGFDVETEAVDAGTFFNLDLDNEDSYARFNADMQLFAVPTPSPYPLEFSERFYSQRAAGSANEWREPNISRYNNPEFDMLHKQALIEMRPAIQAGIWHRMMSILTEDAVVVPIVRYNSLAAIHDRIAPAPFSPWAVAPSWNLKDWEQRE